MPQTWCGGLITPIYKSGGRSDRQKIPVYLCLQLPGKTILFYLKPTTSRIYRFFEYTPQSQIGFIPNNRTADHVFTLRTLIDKYVHNTVKGLNPGVISRG